MKALSFSILAVLVPIFAQAQQLIFANNASTPITAYGTNANATVGLFGYAISGQGGNDSFLLHLATVNTYAPGLFDGGTLDLGVAPGSVVTLQVRAWSTGYPTFNAATIARATDPSVIVWYEWRQNVWEQTVGGGALPPEPITGPGRFQGLTVVPEPSSGALALVGAAALFLFRRKLRRS